MSNPIHPPAVLTIGILQKAMARLGPFDKDAPLHVPIEKIPSIAGILEAFEGGYPDWDEVDRLERGTKAHGLDWLKKECAQS